MPLGFNPQATNYLRPIQPCQFRHSRDKWKHISRRIPREDPPPSSFSLITWNVDFMAPEKQNRLEGVLDHIRYELLVCDEKTDEPEPAVILLQEVHREAFQVLLDDPWLRDWFTIAPIDPENHWPSTNNSRAPYGIVTLVSNSIPVKNAMSLEFGCSNQHRSALMVDIQLTPTRPSNGKDAVIVRVANTHLESMGGHPHSDCRSLQLRLVARYLVEEHQGAIAGILGGDLNAIDGKKGVRLEEVGLRDAWKRTDNDPEGITWGPQRSSTDSIYPDGRLDKILYTRKNGVRVGLPDVMGKNVMALDSDRWASDHYCLVTDVSV